MLTKQRAQIDAIDERIVQLLEARLKIVEEVAAIKQKNELPIFDEAREESLLAKLESRVEDTAYTILIEEIFKCLLKVSKEHQADIITKGREI